MGLGVSKDYFQRAQARRYFLAFPTSLAFKFNLAAGSSQQSLSQNKQGLESPKHSQSDK